MTEEDRIDSESLLRAIQRYERKKGRGRLKIFLGMAAGVGKTYAMLKAAQERVQEGVNLVVASVYTHGRPETEKLLVGLPRIPEKEMEYRGKTFKELDLDAVLKLKPELVLVDELAHSNIPGSRHEKRWHDVLEIIESGIDVYTTLNIQHIESYKELVEEIVGIKIGETVPDLVFEKASDVELIDITPEALLERLKEGKVYTGDLSEIAAINFFQEDRITALREIVLRFTAEVVNNELQEIFLILQKRKGWRPREHLLVAIDQRPVSQQLIRTTRRRAFMLHAPWIVLYVDDGRKLDEEESGILTKNFSLARELGAEVMTTLDSDIARGILRIAEQKEVTQIIVGKREKRFKNPFRRSLIFRLLKESNTINVQIIREPFLFHKKKKKWFKDFRKLLIKREQTSQAFYEIVKEIAGGRSTNQIFSFFKEKMGSILDGKFEIIIKNDALIFEKDSLLDDKEKGVAHWVAQHGKEAGWSTTTLSSAKNLYIPLKGFKLIVGVLVFHPRHNKPLLFDENHFLYTVAQQLANYLERTLSEEKERENKYLQQVEKIYFKVLQTIAHELFQPLDEIRKALLEIKMDHPAVYRIEHSTQSLIHLTENASAMAKLSIGLTKFRKTSQDIHPLLEASTKKFVPLKERLVLRVQPDLPSIAFDFSLLELLLDNLLLNAIQYSPPHTPIELEAELVDGSFVLSVADQGPGIPEELIDLIFEKFYRVPGTTSTGLGLGLSIASSIAQIHQGEMKVRNRPKGGATFFLILPHKEE